MVVELREKTAGEVGSGSRGCCRRSLAKLTTVRTITVANVSRAFRCIRVGGRECVAYMRGTSESLQQVVAVRRIKLAKRLGIAGHSLARWPCHVLCAGAALDFVVRVVVGATTAEQT